MPNILKQLKLTELSLVDRPANPEAMAPIFKAETTKGDNMEDVIKMSDNMKAILKPYVEKGMSPEDAIVAYEGDMNKSAATLKAENERLRKALIENGFVIKAEAVEKKAAPEYIEVEGEQIAKSDIPAPILKKLEEAEIEKAQAAVEKKADNFPNLKKEVAVKLVKADLLEDEELVEFLRAVDALMGKAMEERGETATNGDMSDPVDALNKRVAELATEQKITKEQAFAKLSDTKEGADMVKRAYYKKEA